MTKLQNTKCHHGVTLVSTSKSLLNLVAANEAEGAVSNKRCAPCHNPGVGSGASLLCGASLGTRCWPICCCFRANNARSFLNAVPTISCSSFPELNSLSYSTPTVQKFSRALKPQTKLSQQKTKCLVLVKNGVLLEKLLEKLRDCDGQQIRTPMFHSIMELSVIELVLHTH